MLAAAVRDVTALLGAGKPVMRPAPGAASRVFFALWPDTGACAALDALARACAAQTGGRAPAGENLHLTLAFIGNVTASRARQLGEIGAVAAAAVPPFTLTLDRIGAFHKQGLAWAGPSSPDASLERLARKLGNELAGAGFELEQRAFHPHVTLVRRGRTRLLDVARVGTALATPIVWNVARMTLAVSQQARGGSRYLALDEWALGARR